MTVVVFMTAWMVSRPNLARFRRSRDTFACALKRCWSVSIRKMSDIAVQPAAQGADLRGSLLMFVMATLVNF